jgi:hypothetical protein
MRATVEVTALSDTMVEAQPTEAPMFLRLTSSKIGPLGRSVISLLALLQLIGCGPSHSDPHVAASVNGRSITWRVVKQNLVYAARFDSWIARTHPALRCSLTSTDHRCRQLAREVLARLIQEQLVGAYAARHRIGLSEAEREAVSLSAAELKARSDFKATVYDSRLVTPQFVTQILAREMLVRKIEETVTYPAAVRGPSFQVRRYWIRIGPRLPDKRAYSVAIDLATSGRSASTDTRVRQEWVAAFRLPAPVRQALTAASSGDFVGPFKGASVYTVFELLATGNHSYGQPARSRMELQLFHNWLKQQLARATITCYLANGKATACPATE